VLCWFLRVVLIIVVTLGLPSALIVASIVSAGLATDTIVLSDSPACRRYVYRPNASKSPGSFLEYDHKAEAQSALYASDCYGGSSLVDNCKTHYNQSISYFVENTTCPFDGPTCFSSGNSSIILSTGLLPGSVLGINARIPSLDLHRYE
jgi:hypothetical protein